MTTIVARVIRTRTNVSFVPPGLTPIRTPGRSIASRSGKRSRSAARTSGDFPIERYGSDSVATASRPGVRVIPDIAMSKRPASRSSTSVGQLVCTNLTTTPKASPSRRAASISNPS